jgi:NO-binding membrane sensor protein with MHYT domain/GAF domain-containing protein
MIGTYHPVLVALSIVIGVLAFHAGLDFAERATVARGRPRGGWIAAGAAVTGLGVWSLHVLGTLALRLHSAWPGPVVRFRLPEMSLAMVVAIAAMAPVLTIVVRRSSGTLPLMVTGGLLGAAIAGTHYVAMTAMRVPARVAHNGTLVLASIAIALVASTAALWFGGKLRGRGAPLVGSRLGTAVALGAAAAATHYTAMAAIRLTPSAASVAVGDDAALPGSTGVAAVLAAAILTLLGLATMAAAIDRRVRKEVVRGEEHARLYQEAAAARTEAETARMRAEETSRILLEAARVLGSSLDLDAALRHVTGLFVPRFADYCLVYLQEPDGSFTQAAAAHVDPTKSPLLEELRRRYRPNPASPDSALGRVLRTGRPVSARTVSADEATRLTTDPDVVRIFRELGPTSYAVVPLVARGGLLGAVSLIMSTSNRRLREADVTLIELLGARAGLAIDNARLFTEARDAHDQAIRASRLEGQLMQARLEALRAQLNPHFLFNALNTVAMLVRRGANEDALRAVVSLSEVLRRALAGQSAQEVSLREELALVEHYLQIEQLRFRDRLTVDVAVEPQALEASVPGFVLQPLVENAVGHGVARHAGSGRIEISGRRETGRLVLEVRDNGPGFPEGWEVVASGRVGLANTRERLSRLYGGACRFEARNAPEGGALVTIEIPFTLARREGSRRR